MPGATPARVPSSRGEELLASEDLAILGLLAEGLSLDGVSRRVGLSERTVRRRCRQICDRLGVDAPIQAVVWAVRCRLL